MVIDDDDDAHCVDLIESGAATNEGQDRHIAHCMLRLYAMMPVQEQVCSVNAKLASKNAWIVNLEL